MRKRLTIGLAIAAFAAGLSSCTTPQSFSSSLSDDRIDETPPPPPIERDQLVLSGQVPEECWRTRAVIVGGDPTQVPISMRIPDLACWLAHNPDVAESLRWETEYYGSLAWKDWDSALQKKLVDRFEAMWCWAQTGRTSKNPFGIMDPPPNKLADTLADGVGADTVLWNGDAWNLYSTQVATSLYVELSALVPWSLTSLSAPLRAEILDSRRLFLLDENAKGYRLSFEDGFSLPAAGDTALDFLLDNNIAKSTRQDTIGALLEWERRNLQHIYEYIRAGEMERVYGYRGFPPAATVITGSIDKKYGFAHWIAGCIGNTGFLRSMLRIVNIPVERVIGGGGHTMPRFYTPSVKYLSHGDEPYSGFFWSLPPGPGAELLIDQGTWDKWFVDPTPDAAKANVGRRVVEIALARPSLYVTRDYCSDQAQGLSHADGSVYEDFKHYSYTLAEVEASGIWDLMDAMLATVGGCANVEKLKLIYYPKP